MGDEHKAPVRRTRVTGTSEQDELMAFLVVCLKCGKTGATLDVDLGLCESCSWVKVTIECPCGQTEDVADVG